LHAIVNGASTKTREIMVGDLLPGMGSGGGAEQTDAQMAECR